MSLPSDFLPFAQLGPFSYFVKFVLQSCIFFLSVFTHRGRWSMLHRTLHPTAASATHPCLPSTRPPLSQLLKAHRPVSASFTVGAGLRPTLGHLTTPTPCLTRTPSPTTPLPTSSHSSTSPTTPSRPSAPPPVPSWSAGTWSLMMRWGEPGAWCCCGAMIAVEGGFTLTPTLWAQTQAAWVLQEDLTPLYQPEPTLMAPCIAVEEVEEEVVLDQCVQSPPIQQRLYKESWWKAALSTGLGEHFITTPTLLLCWPWGCGYHPPPPHRRYPTWGIPMQAPCLLGGPPGGRVWEGTLWLPLCLETIPKLGDRVPG